MSGLYANIFELAELERILRKTYFCESSKINICDTWQHVYCYISPLHGQYTS